MPASESHVIQMQSAQTLVALMNVNVIQDTLGMDGIVQVEITLKLQSIPLMSCKELNCHKISVPPGDVLSMNSSCLVTLVL